MSPSTREKYAARLTELEALQHELQGGKRSGDVAVVVGLLLEAAGDVLRRRSALGVTPARLSAPLQAIPEPSLRSWVDGVQVNELSAKLERAMSQAVEAAIPDSPEEGAAMAQFVVQDLQARDRLESALVALEALAALGRGDAQAHAQRLRQAVAPADERCRGGVASLTALNGPRRAEAALLDAEFRGQAWWFSERTGIDDDQLVQVLGGEAKGSLPAELMRVSTEVTRKRSRRVSFDDLLRADLGLATAAEREFIRRQAEVDPELKLSLAAMDAAEAAIVELSQDAAPAAAPVSVPVERSAAPVVIEERPDFKVLVFRSKRGVQVVVQPRDPHALAAALVQRSDEPERSFPSRRGEMGQHFELGPPEALAGVLVRVSVKLIDGQTDAVEVRL
jgi:hypothetical protein